MLKSRTATVGHGANGNTVQPVPTLGQWKMHRGSPSDTELEKEMGAWASARGEERTAETRFSPSR